MRQQAHSPRLVAATLVAAAGMIASCTDDELGPPQPGEGLAHVAEHLAVVTSAVWAASPIAPTGDSLARAHAVPSPFEFPCSAGGSTLISAVRRESPYNTFPFQVQRAEHTNCQHLVDPEDPQGARLELNGVEELGRSGSLSGGGVVEYRRNGNADGTMPMTIRSSNFGAGLIEQSEIRLGRWDIRWTAVGDTTVKEATAVHSYEVFYSYTNGSLFEGRYSLGTAARPFRVRTQGDFTRLSGAYEIDTPNCSTGSMRVETQQDLEYDGATGSFSSGKLRFVGADGGSAIVTFVGGGRVSIEDASGVTEIEDWRTTSLAWTNECFGQWVE